MNYSQAVEKLSKYGQEHILKYYDVLSESEKEELLKQIEDTDFEVIKMCKNKNEAAKKGEITPLQAMK